MAQLMETCHARPILAAVDAVASTGTGTEVAQVLAVEPQQELRLSSLPELVVEGRYLTAGDDAAAVLGSRLAAHLGAGIGDEVVLLGSTGRGGSVATVATVVGIVDIAQRELDRILMLVPLGYFQHEVELEDHVHQIVVRLGDLERAEALATALNLGELAGTGTVAYSWRELMPDMVAALEFKLRSQYLVAVVLAIMVTVSIANTFLMMIFERTRELGMMKALGMRSAQLIGMLQIEALLLCLIGLASALLLVAAVVLPLGSTGLVVSATQSEMMRQMQAPDRLYPALTPLAVGYPCLLFMLTTQVAALIPALRLRRLDPVEALREE